MDRLLTWLDSSYKQGTRLNGLIYLHRISDPRMAGSSMKHLSMFRRLCGSDNFKNVILGTTFWGNIKGTIGEERERELSTSNQMWGSMVKKGSKVVRVLEDRPSNLAIFEHIARNNGKIVIEAQKEMLAENSRFNTADALDLGIDIHDFREQRRKERYHEQIRLQNEERKRERVWQQQFAAVRAETSRQQRIAKEKAETEERLQRERRERERDAQRRREQREREEIREEAAQLEILASQALKNQRLKEANCVYWRNYVCKCQATYDQRCARCARPIHKNRPYYYRQFVFRARKIMC